MKVLSLPWQARNARNFRREQAKKIQHLHIRMRLQRWCADEQSEREEVEKVAKMVRRLLADEDGATALK
ncbi:MAG: hypothetical protein HY664_08065 [Chloroflexi bacterium]|nr:hypothetical protein [Chloroflexota bacterium]